MQLRQASIVDKLTGLSLPVKRTRPFQIMRAVVTIRPAHWKDSISDACAWAPHCLLGLSSLAIRKPISN